MVSGIELMVIEPTHEIISLRCRGTIVMPNNAPATELAANEGILAAVVEYDSEKTTRKAFAEARRAEHGLTLILPSNHFGFVAGQLNEGLLCGSPFQWEWGRKKQDWPLWTGDEPTILDRWVCHAPCAIKKSEELGEADS